VWRREIARFAPFALGSPTEQPSQSRDHGLRELDRLRNKQPDRTLVVAVEICIVLDLAVTGDEDRHTSMVARDGSTSLALFDRDYASLRSSYHLYGITEAAG
jgi:hypothetical protein